MAWFDHRCSALAAALAFYSLFALAPMLLIVIAIAGYFFGAGASSGQLFGQLRAVMGPDAAMFIQNAVDSAGKSGASTGVAWVSLIAILVSASVTFAELKAALNTIFISTSVPNKRFIQSTWALVRVRLISVALLAGLAFLLTVSLALDSAVAALQSALWHDPSITLLFKWAEVAITLSLLTLMFTGLLRILPDARVSLRATMVGALVSAILFVIGKGFFSLYLAELGSINIFGAAGSLAVVLMWLFYSSSVFLFGAEVAREMHART